MAMENGPFVSDVPCKTSIHGEFSRGMFDYQRVYHDISIVFNCWLPMLFDAVSVYMWKCRAEFVCIYEL